jgi:hypothetical protein
MFSIQFFGYSSMSGSFSTITQARKVLNGYKRVDRLACRAHFRRAKVTVTKDSYKITIGCNLYSAASIVRG